MATEQRRRRNVTRLRNITALDVQPNNIFKTVRDMARRLHRLEAELVQRSTWSQFTVLKASRTWDPGVIANGGVGVRIIECQGAKKNDPVVAAFDQLGAALWMITAHVETDDSVRCVILNRTGANVDLAEGTLTVWVFQTEEKTEVD